MSNLLLHWLETAQPKLEGMGYTVTYKNAVAPNSGVSADLDGKDFLGGICHWPPDLFEFQFHNSSSGEIVVLETLRFDNVKARRSYIESLVLERLRR